VYTCHSIKTLNTFRTKFDGQQMDYTHCAISGLDFENFICPFIEPNSS